MMIEVTGEPILKLKGRRRDMVAEGPKPGRIPTIVPRTAPMRAKVKLVRENARPNPSAKPWKMVKISPMRTL
jgi:hypothetical protein